MKTTISLKAQKRNGRIRKTENLKNPVNVRLEEIDPRQMRVETIIGDQKKEDKKSPGERGFLLKFNFLRTNQVDTHVNIKRIGQAIHLSVWIIT